MAHVLPFERTARGPTGLDTTEREIVEATERLATALEPTGARSTSERFGLDRFWRNARVHTLHDPVDYKLRDIGRHALDGRLPEPTAYS